VESALGSLDGTVDILWSTFCDSAHDLSIRGIYDIDGGVI
jgi:hypothetical protein